MLRPEDFGGEKSVPSTCSESRPKERFKNMLAEQVQINEKLEFENEKKKIQIRNLMNLLKSRAYLLRQGEGHQSNAAKWKCSREF